MTKKYNLRDQLIVLFSSCEFPLCFSKIENSLEGRFNKTSIYRQLDKLISIGKINKMETSRGAFYELKEPSGNHLHTHCEKCNDIKCVESQKIPDIKEKAGFVSKQFSLVIEGICKNCNEK